MFKKTNDAGIIPIGSKGGLLESFKKKQNEDISGFDEDMMLPSMFQKSKDKGGQSIPGVNFNFDSNVQNQKFSGANSAVQHLFKGTTSNFLGK